jgi:hypothetical protein
MKAIEITMAAAILAISAGCSFMEEAELQKKQRAEANTWLVESFRDAAIENAIVREHTIYPYQFIQNSADMTELGRRDMRVLAEFFRDNPGQLNVRKADTPDELYDKRVKKVVRELADAGVDMDRMDISDGLPGGDGITGSEAVLHFKDKVLQVEQEEKTTTAWTSTTDGGSTTTGE